MHRTRFPDGCARFAPVLALLLALVPGAVRAASTAWVEGTGSAARLITAVDATGELATVPAALEVRLEPGWHTYWRSPGDAGLPPQLDWSLSANLADLALAYPAPVRTVLLGFETFGYKDHVVFPLTLTPATPGAAMDIRVSSQLLVCSEICVPVGFTFALELPAGPAAVDAEAANLIDRAVETVPGDGQAVGLAIESLMADGETLTVVATSREPFATPDLIVEGRAGDAFAAPVVETSTDGRRLTATIARIQTATKVEPLTAAPLTVTLVDPPRAMEATATPAAGALAAGGAATDGAGAGGAGAGGAGAGGTGAAAPATSLFAMLGIALLGGLILNLMPCVLPVLSLKLLGAVQAGAGQAGAGRVRAGFLASAAGILVSFLALAGLAIGLGAAGETVGWGIQFQEPLFLVAMVVLLTLFACNLLGLFEIVLPSRVTDAAGRAGAGRPLLAPFATGVFATLLATPCSAPFLGTAIGFALTRGPGEIVAIFTALGIGFAAPYLLVAAFPALARLLPRPGRWMIVLKAILAAALFATGAWLLTVLAIQIGVEAAVAIALLMVALTALLWLRRRLPRALAATALAGMAITLTGAFAAPLVLDRAAPDRPAPDLGAASAQWVAFERDAIAGRVAAGEVVFVDITAEWCLTCRVNKTFVLDSQAVVEALAGTTAMRGDWTSPDPAIADFLADNGRYGIPFNIVYGPAAPAGIILPELLTEGSVLDAIARASGTVS